MNKKTNPRSERLDARVSKDEKELAARCAKHFARLGIKDAGVSEFLRDLVVLYATEHGIPLFEGDTPGEVGETEDLRRLASKQEKIASGLRRMRARSGA